MKILTTFLISFSVLFLGCSNKTVDVSTNDHITKVASSNDNADLIKTIERMHPTKTDWQLRKASGDLNTKISTFFFLSPNIGWAYGESRIHKTVNGGDKWISYSIGLGKTIKVVSLVFTNESIGWMVCERVDGERYSKNDEILIYRSSDGGKSWTLSHSEKSATDAQIYQDEMNVWVVARRFIGYRPMRLSPIVIFYDHREDVWSDVSGSFRELNYDPRFIEGSFPLIRAIAFRNFGCVVIVNHVGKIFESCDDGVDWSNIGTIESANDPSRSNIRSLKIADGFVWILDSSGGYYHGSSTLITIMKNSDKYESIFHTIKLPGYFTQQAFAVSPSEFFLVVRKFENTGRDSTPRDFILNTKDGGQSWLEIFTPPNAIQSAQMFSTKDRRLFWILTDDGNLQELVRE